MATTQKTAPASAASKVAAGPIAEIVLKRAKRRKVKAAGRKKRVLKLRTDKEFAKTYFAARSKRSTDKKSAFRKAKTKKK